MTARARKLREHQTASEKEFRRLLNDAKLGKLFKSQHPILHYIIDFFSVRLRLAIEIDGPTHATQQEYDAQRTQDLQSQGIRVLRFTNAEVWNSPTTVIEAVRHNIHLRRAIKGRNGTRTGTRRIGRNS